jgi:nucleoside 2-deoxyribosyltransferase
MARKNLVYLAAPLFSEAERLFNLQLAESLAPFAKVFLPQRDNGLLADLLGSGLSLEAAQAQNFEGDLLAIREADILVVVLDGRAVDEGACFELGVAYALGKICIGLQTDPRRLLPSGNNPMLEGALSKVFPSVSELVQRIASSRYESMPG